jgi:amicoumacin kinase
MGRVGGHDAGVSSPQQLFAPWEILDGEPPVLVRRSSNDVFRARRRGQTVFLRVTPARHRTPREVEEELRWMSTLAAAGLPVVRPIPSASGRLIEPARVAGAAVCLACFEAAPGRPARKPDDYRPPIIEGWATLLADLHEQSRAHPSADGGRASWSQDRVFATAVQASADETRPAQAALRELVAWMRGLETGRDVFGLTHADLHLGNLAVDGDRITAFDFDDACHHWFLHDVAVAVMSIRKAGWEYPDRFDAPGAEGIFLARYFDRGILGPAWRARLEALIAYRVALSACWASRAAETGELDAEMQAWFQRSLPWWLGQLEDRRDLILRAMSA